MMTRERRSPPPEASCLPRRGEGCLLGHLLGSGNSQRCNDSDCPDPGSGPRSRQQDRGKFTYLGLTPAR